MAGADVYLKVPGACAVVPVNNACIGVPVWEVCDGPKKLPEVAENWGALKKPLVVTGARGCPVFVPN